MRSSFGKDSVLHIMNEFLDYVKDIFSRKFFSVDVVSVTTSSSFKLILGAFEECET
jgi:hypothetical protein